MTDSLMTGWSQAQADGSRALYRRVLGLNLILHVLIGLACIFLPYWFSHLVSLPEPFPAGWVRGWGATLILVTALYVPGYLDPTHNRMPNIIGILGRLWMAIIWTFCGGGFLWLALFDFVFFLILGFLYLRFLQNTLMSKP
jgi:hypothetical protein